jgi:hypothetical protein
MISALNSQTFDVLWTAETGVSLTGAPTADPFDRFIVARTHRPGSPGNVFVFATSGHLIWREDFTSENGGMIMPTGGPTFSADGDTFYLGTVIPGQNVNNEYSYVYAYAVQAQNPLRAPISIGAVSRKSHGSAGTFDVELPLTGTAGVEPRSGGANGSHQVVVSFATPITLEGAAVSDGGGSVSSYNVSGSKAILNLTGVANAATTTVTLNAVNDGLTTGPVTVRLSTLLGDTNGNGTVNASDVGQTKAAAGQAITEANFRSDVTPNGTINASDIGQVKAQSGTRLP